MADPFFQQNYIDEGQKAAGVTANDFLFLLAANAHLAVIDRDLTTPPGTIVEGAIYIPTATATGAWTGWEGDIVIGHGGAWVNYTPLEGWGAWVNDENAAIHYDGSAWTLFRPSSINATITAGTTQTQAGATVLTQAVSWVTTANVDDGVKLITAAAGVEQTVVNHTAVSIRVWPNTSDKINGGTVDVHIDLAAGKTGVFRARDGTDWRSLIGA